jgi:lysozyme family protein
MSASSFTSSLAAVLAHEGGYVNHPADPGGATNCGVIQTVYDEYRLSRKLPPRSVRFIEASEVAEIYRQRYWNAIRGDDLPSGVDYCVFDFAVNSGVDRAARYLQRACEAPEDGKIGPVTVAAAKNQMPVSLIEKVCAARLNFLRQLKIFDTFGRGWTRRVEEVCAKAKAMAA